MRTAWLDGIALNEPLQVIPGAVEIPGVVSTDSPNIILDAVKLAEDGSGDVILRLYESKHCDTNARIHVRIPGTIEPCSILEKAREDERMQVCAEKGTQEVLLHFAPFQVRTLRIRRASDSEN